MSDDIQFTCSECRKEFDPDPDCVMVLRADAAMDYGEGTEPEPCNDCELSLEDREDAKKELGVSDEELDRMLAGEAVDVGGIIICKECQDKLAEASND
jgi:hypothetical protein